MRVNLFITLALLTSGLGIAQNLIPVSRATAERYAAAAKESAGERSATACNGPRAKVSMWIWSDEYVSRARR